MRTITTLMVGLGMFMLAHPTNASGTFNCESESGFVKILGTNSSAGITVQEVVLGERIVANFSVPFIYLGTSWFAFLIKDEHYDKDIVRAETIVNSYNDEMKTIGFTWVGSQKNRAKMFCSFGY